MKRVLMITAQNKADVYELLKVIWAHPMAIELNKMITRDRDEASMPLNYSKGLVANDIRKELLKGKRKDCIVVGYYTGDTRYFYIRASYIKQYFDVLAPYIDLIEDSNEVYSITTEHAEEFIEDHIVKTTCIDDHMKITAIYDRFVTVNPSTNSGYCRHNLLVMTGYDISTRMNKLHTEIKAMNRFKPFSKSEVMYATIEDGTHVLNDIKLYKCDTEKCITYGDRDEFNESNPEADKDLTKLIKRSVCYFV